MGTMGVTLLGVNLSKALIHTSQRIFPIVAHVTQGCPPVGEMNKGALVYSCS